MITINLTHVLIWVLGVIIIYNLSPDDYKKEFGLFVQYIFPDYLDNNLCYIV